MGYSIIIKPLAERDISDAIEWYLERGKSLSGRFLGDIDSAVLKLHKDPQLYQKRYDDVRIIFTETFPYGIYYTIEGDTIYIHAVLHTKRNPKLGTGRI